MRALLFLGLLVLTSHLPAAPNEFSSAATRTHLLELFTSEGCSSCPPAEKWLTELQTASGLWRDFVPVAWHVDYWDRLGWKDRFASRAATQRQHDYAGLWNARSVYTPCFVVDGREWSASRQPPPASREPASVLRATYDNGKLHARFTPERPGNYTVHAVILATDLVSKVTAGENSGRTLRHGFIARAQNSAALRDNTADLILPPDPSEPKSRRALAVWVTRHADLAPLQATGGWLP